MDFITTVSVDEDGYEHKHREEDNGGILGDRAAVPHDSRVGNMGKGKEDKRVVSCGFIL